jgi:hypothetical protein
MGSDPKVNDPTTIMREHEKDEQQPEGRCRNNEEVSRDQIARVILQKSSPGLRGGPARTNHILGDRAFGNLDAEFLEFAVDTWSTPAWVGHDHALDQLLNFAGCARVW